GIRDKLVTGVQTCALPILARAAGVDGERVAVARAPLFGLARVIAHEHPELRPSVIDLGDEADLEHAAAAIAADEAEEQIVVRGGERRVARLRGLARPTSTSPTRLEPAGDASFAADVVTPGILDSTVLRSADRRAPGRGEV